MDNQPLYEHDNHCQPPDVFTGHGDVTMPDGQAVLLDFWYCHVMKSVIARYGNDGPEYTSFGSLGYDRKVMDLDPRLKEAYRRAVIAGLIEEKL